MRTNGKYSYCTAQQALSGGMKEADPVEMWEAGNSLRQIAKAMGITCGEVTDALQDAGCYVRTKIDPEYIREMAEAGRTGREMAVEFGVTVQHISSYMRRVLPELYKPYYRTPQIKRISPEDYLELVRDGAGVTVIAARFGVTTDVIWKWLENHPEMPIPKHKLDVDRGKIRALYKAGPQWHPAAIAFDTCLPERIVRGALREMAAAGELKLREEDRDE